METTAVRSSRLRLPSPVGRTSASIVQLPTENTRLSGFFALMKPRVMLLAVFTSGSTQRSRHGSQIGGAPLPADLETGGA